MMKRRILVPGLLLVLTLACSSATRMDAPAALLSQKDAESAPLNAEGTPRPANDSETPSTRDAPAPPPQALPATSASAELTVPAAATPPSPALGCVKDTDCKGDRICEDGRCVNFEPK